MTTTERIGKVHWQERGQRIERARKFTGLTQGQLAAMVSEVIGYKVGRQIIHILEKGDRDIRNDELRCIAIVLEQSEDWLDGEEDSTFNEAALHNVDHWTFPWFRRPIDVYAEAA